MQDIQRARKTRNPVSVMMLMFDMVSTAHFHRMLPKTVSALSTLSTHYSQEVFQFEGYNIVGEDSIANQVPMLCGQRVEDLPSSPNDQPEYGWTGPVDDWPWIWKYFKAMGYVTHFSSDDCVSLVSIVFSFHLFTSSKVVLELHTNRSLYSEESILHI